MGTTIVVRGEEWFQSVASHLELFSAFGFSSIPYLHTPTIAKLDNGKKRKLSKRSDPEADCRYYLEDGYPIDAVKEYLLNLINSDFEEWRRNNPTLNYREFPFAVNKVTTSNPIFDLIKLNDVSKEYISRLTAEQFYDNLYIWSKKYDKDFAKVLSSNKEYAIEVFNIDRGGDKPRKDIYKWSMVKDYYTYMFEKFENIDIDFASVTQMDYASLYKCLHTYVILFDEGIDKNTWFERVKKMADNFGYTSDNKQYKANPDKYLGNLASFCNLIRYAFTGRINTPDLYSICAVLGKNELYKRLERIKKLIN